MKKFAIFLSFIFFACISYAGYRLLMQMPEETLAEYPWWEDYVDFHEQSWQKLMKELQLSPTYCSAKQQTQKHWGIDYSFTVTWCINVDDTNNFVMTRTLTGLFNITLHEKSWEKTNQYPLFHRMMQEFPNGPFALLEPKLRDQVFYRRKISEAEFIAGFKKAVLENENGSSNFTPYKWKIPIKFIVFDFSNHDFLIEGKTLTAQTQSFINELAHITQHEIKIANVDETPNHLVFFYDKSNDEHPKKILTLYKDFLIQNDANEREIKSLTKLTSETIHDAKTLCGCVLSDLQKKQKNGMKSNQLSVSVDLIPYNTLSLDEIIGCIHEEISQCIGITNDVRTNEPSIFNDQSPYERLSNFDKLMLKLLYQINTDVEPKLFKIELQKALLAIQKNDQAAYEKVFKSEKLVYSFTENESQQKTILKPEYSYRSKDYQAIRLQLLENIQEKIKPFEQFHQFQLPNLERKSDLNRAIAEFEKNYQVILNKIKELKKISQQELQPNWEKIYFEFLLAMQNLSYSELWIGHENALFVLKHYQTLVRNNLIDPIEKTFWQDGDIFDLDTGSWLTIGSIIVKPLIGQNYSIKTKEEFLSINFADPKLDLSQFEFEIANGWNSIHHQGVLLLSHDKNKPLRLD